eukprot:6003523-Prymnesium_polylepis.1
MLGCDLCGGHSSDRATWRVTRTRARTKTAFTSRSNTQLEMRAAVLSAALVLLLGCVGGRAGEAESCAEGEQPSTESSSAPESLCKDQSDHCVTWANAGECTGNPKFMLSSCPASCGACEAVEALAARRADPRTTACDDSHEACA